MLKGYGNKADFLGYCINQFGIGPLHYISSDFGFEFAEIFVIEKRLPDIAESGSRQDCLYIDTIFFKPLNKSMVIVHYILGLFFC